MPKYELMDAGMLRISSLFDADSCFLGEGSIYLLFQSSSINSVFYIFKEKKLSYLQNGTPLELFPSCNNIKIVILF